jgi:CheY-like chemotaxis protein
VTEPRILVVDDDEDVRNMLCLVLSAEGYAATGAVDGVDALRQMRQGEPPALIVIDLMMPRMDGDTLIHAMAEDASLANVPIAVISGQLASGAQAAGPQVIARMVKPIELTDLLSVVHQYASPAAPGGQAQGALLNVPPNGRS